MIGVVAVPSCAETSVVEPAARSRSHTWSEAEFTPGCCEPPATNATREPSPLSEKSACPVPLAPPASAPLAPSARLATASVPAARSATSTCSTPAGGLAPPAAAMRFGELVAKATMVPSLEMRGSDEQSLPVAPAGVRLTSTVVPVSRSRRNTSQVPFVSKALWPTSTFGESEVKAA